MQNCAMDEGKKFLFGLAFGPVLVIAGVIGWQVTWYIPSDRMAQAARTERFSADARADMARLLRYCRKHGDTHFRAADIGVRYHQITSWRNDAGWLGQTEVHCADGQACTVKATAWIAAPIEGSGCDIASWLPVAS